MLFEFLDGSEDRFHSGLEISRDVLHAGVFDVHSGDARLQAFAVAVVVEQTAAILLMKAEMVAAKLNLQQLCQHHSHHEVGHGNA